MNISQELIDILTGILGVSVDDLIRVLTSILGG